MCILTEAYLGSIPPVPACAPLRITLDPRALNGGWLAGNKGICYMGINLTTLNPTSLIPSKP